MLPNFPLLSMDDLHGFYAKTGNKEEAWALMVAEWGEKPEDFKRVMLARLDNNG